MGVTASIFIMEMDFVVSFRDKTFGLKRFLNLSTNSLTHKQPLFNLQR